MSICYSGKSTLIGATAFCYARSYPSNFHVQSFNIKAYVLVLCTLQAIIRIEP